MNVQRIANNELPRKVRHKTLDVLVKTDAEIGIRFLYSRTQILTLLVVIGESLLAVGERTGHWQLCLSPFPERGADGAR